MKAYVIKDKNDFPVASTFFEPQAIKYCNENEGCSYILLPFLTDEETEIHMIAGPIDKKYLPKDFLK
jgi:hypothetical protein